MDHTLEYRNREIAGHWLNLRFRNIVEELFLCFKDSADKFDVYIDDKRVV
jgi:hypothetical protein